MRIFFIFAAIINLNYFAMKRMKKNAILFLLLMGMMGGAFAQAPYKHSIGGTVGSLNAFFLQDIPDESPCPAGGFGI